MRLLAVLALRNIKEIDQRMKQDFAWPRGYEYRFTGEHREQEKAQAFLSKAFVAAQFIILMILLAQFNSFTTPVIILSSVVLSLIGVFFGLLVTDTVFGIIMTGIGVISLAGVVVNTPLCSLDYYHQLLARGVACRDALLQAGLTRFRPVMLTAITTLLGLLPMATGVSFDFKKFGWDIVSESSQLGAGLIGGIAGAPTTGGASLALAAPSFARAVVPTMGEMGMLQAQQPIYSLSPIRQALPQGAGMLGYGAPVIPSLEEQQ